MTYWDRLQGKNLNGDQLIIYKRICGGKYMDKDEIKL